MRSKENLVISNIVVKALVLLTLSFGAIAEEYFSCDSGSPSCLNYGAKVCPSTTNCVDKKYDACFESNTCGYQGFTCKSDYDNLKSDNYNLETDKLALTLDYNKLVRTSTEIAERCDRTTEKYNDLVDDYNSLLNKWKNISSEYDDLEDKYRDLESCVSNAYDLDNAKNCL
jgi:hypothetical protein